MELVIVNRFKKIHEDSLNNILFSKKAIIHVI